MQLRRELLVVGVGTLPLVRGSVKIGNHSRHVRAVGAPGGAEQLRFRAVKALDSLAGDDPHGFECVAIEGVGHRQAQRPIVGLKRQDFVAKGQFAGYHRQRLRIDRDRLQVHIRYFRLDHQRFAKPVRIDVAHVAENGAEALAILLLNRKRLVELFEAERPVIKQDSPHPLAGFGGQWHASAE